MPEPQRLPFLIADEKLGDASLLPFLPLTLSYQDRSINTQGLLDTGSTVNVLPYHIGIELGAVWEQQTVIVQLTGNLAQLEARALVVSASIGQFDPVRLAFAWTQANHVPLILGQVNFFMEFDVCFFRTQAAFEIQPSRP